MRKGTMRIILTPIAKTCRRGGVDSRRDYEEQVSRNIEGQPWMWDDVSPKAGGNKGMIGDLFGFVFNYEKVVLHRVEDVKPPSERLPSWFENCGQRDRNVLFLSDSIRTITWEEWILWNGYKIQGTIYVKRKYLYDKIVL